MDPLGRESLTAAMGREGDLVEDRLRRGCRAFAAWLGGDLVAYGWLTAGPEWIGEIGLEIQPAPGEAYLWNCVTLAAWRRRGLFRLLVASITLAVQKEGMRRLWIASLAGTAEEALATGSFQPCAEITPLSGRAGWYRVEPADLRVLGLGHAQDFEAGAARRH